MPIKRPKAVKLPLPFADLRKSPDDDVRRRAILMQRDLEGMDGFSWNDRSRQYGGRRPGAMRRMLFAGGALAMGGVLVGGLMVADNVNFIPEPQIVYLENWSGDRTAADAVAERDAAMADFRRRYAAHHEQLAVAAEAAGDVEAATAARAAIDAAREAQAAEQARAEQAHAEAVAREKAAARAATPSF